MLLRFSLYGFLKNQRYFEPFFLLAMLDKLGSFTMVGLLLGFREICINVLEVPTGAIADVAGRRLAMVLSFLAYIGSFVLFALCEPAPLMFAAMFLFSVGEAFRTGTHKAIIFDWLAREGRDDEKTKVYGLTRSWSKLGSAVNVLLAAGIFFAVRDYSWLFLICIVPYVANIANFLTYPSYLDGRHEEKGSGTFSARSRPSHLGLPAEKVPDPFSEGHKTVARTLLDALRRCVGPGPLRGLIAESMAYEGVYKVAKDYLQPLLQAAAVATLASAAWLGDDAQRTAVLVGAVYFVLYVLGSVASRRSHVLADRAGSERRAALWLWVVTAGAYAAIAGAVALGLPVLAIVAFVALAIFQNLWRPILITRFTAHADPAQTATILSIESQAKSLAAAVLAPLLGLAVDAMSGSLKLLPVGLLGAAAGLLMLTAYRRRPEAPSDE